MSSLAAVALSLAFAFPAAAAPRSLAVQPAEESAETRALFQSGMDHYARGDLAAALAAFKEVLRREPDNAGALAAVRRLENETTSQQPRREPVRERRRRRSIADAIERFFLIRVPRWLNVRASSGTAPAAPSR